MLVVLTSICAVSGFLLSLVYSFTKEPIEVALLKNKKEPAVKTVLIGFENDPIKDRINIPLGSDKYGRPVNLVVFPAKKGGKTYAVAFESAGKGFAGDIGVMVGLDAAKKDVTGIAVLTHSETPGLGARIASEPSFTDSFKGKSLNAELKKEDVNAISGATYSTVGVVQAVNKAGQTFDKYKDKMLQ